MPLTGALTDQEFSTTVNQALTTLSFWSVLLVEPGKSRTPGELDGESQDTLDLPVETHAVFALMQVFTLLDCQSISLSHLFNR
jgi:hypothetical protein